MQVEKPEQNCLNFRDKKHLFLTYPQCPLSREQLLVNFQDKLGDNLKHYVICQELHEDGNLHLHAYIELNKAIKNTKADFLDLEDEFSDEDYYHPNIGAVRSLKAVIRYLQKEDQNPLSDIQDINSLAFSKAEQKVKDLQLIIENKLTTVDFIRENPEQLPNYERLARSVNLFRLHSLKPFSSPNVRGIWILGPSGVGKSHTARAVFDKYSSIFYKQQSKWFDGYAGEETIVLDDMDHFGGQSLGHHLKIWCDKYPCTGEVKGSTVPLMHKYFVITSNYSIDQMWPDKLDRDGNTIESFRDVRESISRRCVTFRISHRDEVDDMIDDISTAVETGQIFE